MIERKFVEMTIEHIDQRIIQINAEELEIEPEWRRLQKIKERLRNESHYLAHAKNALTNLLEDQRTFDGSVTLDIDKNIQTDTVKDDNVIGRYCHPKGSLESVCEHIAKSIPERLAEGACSHCYGDGKVSDTKDEEPWYVWESLPPGSDIAVKMGLVKPKTCPRCEGTGKEPLP
jgi:hypothetical protein